VRSALFAAFASVTLAAPLAGQGAIDEARAAYLSSRYDDAIREYRALVRRQPAAAAPALGLVHALAAVGRYDDAENEARAFERRNPDDPALANALGETLLLQGKLDEAGAAFHRAAQRAPDSLTARLNLALFAERRGRPDEAARGFDAFIDVYNRATTLGPDQLAAVAGAVRHLGIRNPDLYRDALRAYDEAIAADSDNLDAQVAVGTLFLDKYAGTEARQAFEAVLARAPRHPMALLGLARTRRFAGEPDAMALTDSALAVNPNLVPARVFRATLLTELEDYTAATDEVQRALDVDPNDLEALSLLGAIRYLMGARAGYEEIVRRVSALNPHYAGLYNTAADIAARNRLYGEAAEFAAQATQVDSMSWRAYALLGMNQLRIGRVREGRDNLEHAFAGDPYDVWTKNTLDLLDTLLQYNELTTARFRIEADPKEADVLAVYVGDVAEAAYDSLSRAYGYHAPTPVRIEIYPNHADFSVRSVGLVGLGALGVSFGPVVAMDSPSARHTGEFNWASTLWHEIAHTFHMGLSQSRVPRWFTEGLAVYEERRARPGWGEGPNPGFLIAFRSGRLHPVSQLNNGFMRPAYPQQLIYSYYEASLVCELIGEQHGSEALTSMLRAFGSGASIDGAFRQVVGESVEAFDDDFDRWLRQRFAGPLAALASAQATDSGPPFHDPQALERRARDRADFIAQFTMGGQLMEQDRPREALPYLKRAEELFPDYAGRGSPRELLAVAYRTLGDTARAIEELRALTSRNAGHYPGLLALADLLEATGDHRGAAQALDRSMSVYPLDATVHRRLAQLAEDLEDWPMAIRERRAIVALRPVDRAEALYQLARAYYRGRDLDHARATVLAALEIAPAYQEAQDLLLDIHEARRP